MRLILLLVSINILLSANIIKQQELYEKGLYAESLQEAKSSKDDRSSYKHHLFWAKSAEALGHTNEAMSAYERVLFLDEENVEAMVALINIYRYSDREALELEMSEKLEGKQLTPEQIKSLRISKNRSIYSIKNSASVIIGQDSNINSSPSSTVLDDYVGATGSEGELATSFVRVLGRVSYKNELRTKGGWYTKSELRAYYQNNIDESLYNIFVGTLETGLGYANSKYSFSIPINYDYVYYLEKNLFNQYKIYPKITFPLSQNFIVNLNLAISKRLYVDDADKARDDTTTGFGTSFYYVLGENLVYLNLKYESMSGDDVNPATFVDKTLLTTSLGIKYYLLPDVVGKLDYKLREGSYDDRGDGTSKREDTSNQVDVKFSYIYSRKMEFTLGDKYTKNTSNYTLAEYNKNVVTLGVSLNY